MMVVVHLRLADDLSHKTYVLNLGIDVEGAVLDEFHYIRNSVRNVYVGEFGLLVDESLVPFRTESRPDVCEVLGGVQH